MARASEPRQNACSEQVSAWNAGTARQRWRAAAALPSAPRCIDLLRNAGDAPFARPAVDADESVVTAPDPVQIHRKVQGNQPGEERKRSPVAGTENREQSGGNHAVKKIVPVHVTGRPVCLCPRNRTWVTPSGSGSVAAGMEGRRSFAVSEKQPAIHQPLMI